MRYAMSRSEVENQDPVEFYVDVSQEYQIEHEEVSDLLPQKTPAVDLTATSNSDPMSVDNTDDGELVVTRLKEMYVREKIVSSST